MESSSERATDRVLERQYLEMILRDANREDVIEDVKQGKIELRAAHLIALAWLRGDPKRSVVEQYQIAALMHALES